jgi:repressor LexA
MMDLSRNRKYILDFIHDFIEESGRPPSIREIGKASGIASTSAVAYNLKALSENGLIKRERSVARGLRLTTAARELYGQDNEAEDDLLRIPLAGVIVASEPIGVGNGDFDTFDEEDAITLGKNLLPSKNTKDLFALRVIGNSMIDAMVNDGDIVVMRRGGEVQDGDMVAIWLTPDDTTTLKYFFHEGDRVRLQPANPTLKPIYVEPNSVTVQGKVMMVLRNSFGA